MQLTVCAETVFTDRPLVERFAAIREQRMAGIELWGMPAEQVDRIGAALDSADCRLEIFSGNRDNSLIDSNERDAFLAELERNIVHATRLGCPRLMVLSDKIDSRGIPIPPARPLSFDQRFDSMLQGLKQAVSLADSASIQLLLEPLNTKVDHPGYTLSNSRTALELVRQVGSPRLKVLYDVYHMQIMEGDLISTLESNLDQIGHMHVADVPGRHEPGTGEINYRNVAKMLRSRGYSGCVGLECFPLRDSQSAIGAFRAAFGDPEMAAF